MILQAQEPGFAIDPQAAAGNRPLRAALGQLAHAATCARDAQGNPWDFAVEIESLLAAGLTTSDLRWMVSKGYVEHASEVTRPRDAARKFRPYCNLSFASRTCFVLTEAGARLAAGQNATGSLSSGSLSSGSLSTGSLSSGHPSPAGNRAAAAGAARGQRVPSWDGERRVLSLDGCVVKQFKVPSPSQQAILAAFEEEGWPAAIDDPLPPHPEQDPKRRLRNTIQSLNANQKLPLLRFRGDGSGDRILWELTENAAARLVVKGRGFIRAA